MDLSTVNEYIGKFNNLIQTKSCNSYDGKLKVGVDLGTANIVLAIVDQEGNPIAGASQEAKVVKDGIVVDYIGAVNILEKLKHDIEEMLKINLNYSAIAVPPGTIDGNVKVISNVVESVGMDVVDIIDEPTAAATVLGIQDGAVVDVGGGTTGISILKEGKVIYTADEPTGGTHMTLVLGGSYGISFDEAEKLKRDPKKEEKVFVAIKPVIEKMAEIVKRHIQGYSVDKIYVVGGACSFTKFEEVFTKYIGIKTIKPLNPLLITPLGIALNCNGEGE
ncbi:ethanolamine utilization protein EutJ [Anaerosalibacter massiliensis]|uniref:Ethanolamine utilization protein EutJ n=1 Tax=Anaerosalibacter massiliensis TaxID=1347392 RepID=A0A9X2MJ39_9FIRM|nr:ethanolamine utilization protein EutJ [Anaerosalibacter massiliensis]MCR2044082.1 ethanolamine utilization protein EutJ [Anaerosalibacter massiliensis]